jgi:integrase
LEASQRWERWLGVSIKRATGKENGPARGRWPVNLLAERTEVRSATWSEINLDAGVWTIPADRMKAGRAHRVPLSSAAVKLLKSLPRVVGNAHLFPGASKLGRLSENTLNEVIKRLHGRDAVPSDAPGRPAVVHCMRSTFRN